MTFIHQSVHALRQAVKRHLRQWTQPDNQSLVRNAALDILTRSKFELVLKNALLRPALLTHSPFSTPPETRDSQSVGAGLSTDVLFIQP